MDASARLTTLTRLGFVTRGLLYLVIAWLILRTGRTEDVSGALAYLGQGGGRILLIVMAAGLIGYGLWRLADAAFNIERHDGDKKGTAQRFGAGASGLIHLFLAWQAISLLRGAAKASSGDSAQQGAQTALELPGGTLLLLLAGIVLLGVGVFQLVKAAKASFCDSLDPQVANKPWVKLAGRLGYAARGVVFLISGYFLLRAGLQSEASAAGGMEQALSWLTSPWDVIVAIGLAAFGIYSLIEARYRVLHDVPVKGVAQHARAKLPV